MFHLKDFFYLQRNDRQAIMVLLGIVIVCITLVIVVGMLNPSNGDRSNSQQVHPYATSENAAPGDHPQKKADNGNTAEQEHLYYKVDGVPHELFPFDPNTADSTQLLRLGLQPWQVRSISRYRAKGGIFREPSDFARLYGLTKKQYEILAPYIIIGEDYRPASDYYGRKARRQGYGQGRGESLDGNAYSGSGFQGSYEQNGANGKNGIGGTRGANGSEGGKQKVYSYPQKLKPGQHVSVNSSDTTELMKIPGIGSYYAKVIVRYRDKLGGFASLSQLQEIEGLPKEALPFFTVNASEVKRLNINKLSLNQLRQHPYLNFYQAKEICDYRRLKGPIHNLQELKLLKDFPPDEIERLKPYIAF